MQRVFPGTNDRGRLSTIEECVADGAGTDASPCKLADAGNRERLACRARCKDNGIARVEFAFPLDGE